MESGKPTTEAAVRGNDARMAALDVPKLPRFVWLQTLSVFVPGAVVALEAFALLAPEAFKALLTTTTLSPFGVVVSAISTLCVTYVIGLPLRSIGMWTLPRTRKPADLLWSLFKTEKLEAGDENWDRPVRRAEEEFSTPVVHRILAAAGWATHDDYIVGTRRGTGLFVFTKLWLRQNAPSSAIDDMEVEINVRAALVVPLMLAWLPISRLTWGSPLWSLWSASALFFSVATASATVYRGNQLRAREPYAGFQHFIAAWLVQHPSPPAPGEPPAAG